MGIIRTRSVFVRSRGYCGRHGSMSRHLASSSPNRYDRNGVRAPEPRVDNQSDIALSKNPVIHDRSKQIDVRYHFIWECVDEKKILLSYTATELQLADVLTKALGHVRFEELRAKIGIKVIDDCAQN